MCEATHALRKRDAEEVTHEWRTRAGDRGELMKAAERIALRPGKGIAVMAWRRAVRELEELFEETNGR